MKGEMVALCRECVEKDKIPEDMKGLFGKDELRTSVEWQNLIIDAAMPTPSFHSVHSSAYSEPGRENDEEQEDDEERDGGSDKEPEEISLLGEEKDVQDDFMFEDWIPIKEEDGEQGWTKHITQQQGVIDGLVAKTNNYRAKLVVVANKLDKEGVPVVNSIIKKLGVVATKQVLMPESVDHVSTLIGVLEDRIRATEGLEGDLEGCTRDVAAMRGETALLRDDVQQQASASKETEGVVAGLIQKVNQAAAVRTASVAKRVSALEAKATRGVDLAAKSDLQDYWCYGGGKTTSGIVWVRGTQICNGTIPKISSSISFEGVHVLSTGKCPSSFAQIN